MKVLVTGGAGFIGSHVTDRLIESGVEVVVLDNLSSGKREAVNPRARLYEADICGEGIRALFEQERFDCVDHHAAQMNVRRSVDDPVFDARVNILGSLNLLQAAVAQGCSAPMIILTGMGQQDAKRRSGRHVAGKVPARGGVGCGSGCGFLL